LFKINKKIFVTITASLIGLFLGYGFYSVSDFKGPFEVTKQLNQILKNRNEKELRKISADDETYNFLINLPKTAKCEGTTDAQAGGPEGDNMILSYHVTTIRYGDKSQPLECYLEKDTSSFIPKFTLIKVSLKTYSMIDIWKVV
jgi:hypothetical protein